MMAVHVRGESMHQPIDDRVASMPVFANIFVIIVVQMVVGMLHFMLYASGMIVMMGVFVRKRRRIHMCLSLFFLLVVEMSFEHVKHRLVRNTMLEAEALQELVDLIFRQIFE
jgi:hypothetical protein